MPDWFVLLTPLLLLPIALLFMFIGCGLQTTGIPDEPPYDIPVTLHIVDIPSIADGVKSLEVTFTGEVFGDSTRSTTRTLTHEQIKANSFIDDFEIVSLYDFGTVACKCIVTFFAAPSDAAEAIREKVEAEPLPEFRLSRIDNDFFFF